MNTIGYRSQSWHYDAVDGMVSASTDMHLLDDGQVVSIVQRFCYARRHLLIVSTDVHDLHASHFSYYRSDEKKGGFIIKKRKIVEITKETNQRLRKAVSQTRRIDLQTLTTTVNKEQSHAELGSFEHIIDDLSRIPTADPTSDLSATRDRFHWQGYATELEVDPQRRTLIDATISESPPDTSASATTMQVTTLAQAEPKQTLWIEHIVTRPVLSKIIFNYIDAYKIDELFRKHSKKIRRIREDIDKGNRSESHFFPLALSGDIHEA